MKAFLVVEDDLAVSFRPVDDRAAAVKWLVENIEDPERFAAIYCELHADGTTWAEKVNPDHIDWLADALSLDWQPIYSLGKPNENYLEAEYKAMHCELFFNDRLGSAPMAWDWSFYDDKSDDPDLAVARSDKGFPTKEAAEADLIDYIDGYAP